MKRQRSETFSLPSMDAIVLFMERDKLANERIASVATVIDKRDVAGKRYKAIVVYEQDGGAE